MGASDYMLPGAPQGNSYAAPIVNFGEIGNLPQAWQQGQQYARQRALQTAFPNGLPMDPATGQVDIKAIADTFAKYGDIKEMMPLLQQQMGIQAGQMVNNAGNPPGAQPSGPMAPQPAAGPAAMTGQFPQQPGITPTGMDASTRGQTPGKDNLRQLMTERQIDINSPEGKNVVTYLRSNGIGLDNDLSDEQSAKIRDGLSQLRSQRSTTTQVSRDEGTSQPPFAASSREVAQNTPPAGVSSNDQRTATQPGAAQPPFAPQQRTAPEEIGSRLINAPGDSWQKADNLGKTIDSISKAVTAGGRSLTQQQVEGAKATIANLTEQRKAMVERLTESAKIPAEVQKKRYEAITAADVKQHEALFNGVQALGNDSMGMRDNVLLQRQLVNHPDFKPGPLAEQTLFLQRMVPALAGNPQASELYKKILSNNMLHLVGTLKDTSSQLGDSNGRIFKPMIDMVQQASGTLENSKGGLRGLAELQYRTLMRNVEIANMQLDYKGGHYERLPAEFKKDIPKQVGLLDDNYVRGMRDWMAKHPILTPQERANPLLLEKASAIDPGATQSGKDTGKPSDPYEGRTLINPGTGERLHRENGKWISKSPIPGQT